MKGRSGPDASPPARASPDFQAEAIDSTVNIPPFALLISDLKASVVESPASLPAWEGMTPSARLPRPLERPQWKRKVYRPK